MSPGADKEECVICEYIDIVKKSDDLQYVELRKQGFETLKSYSSKRNEFSLLDHLKSCEENGMTVKVHITCRYFTDPERLYLAKDSSEPVIKKKRLRSIVGGFNWKLNCFLCTKYAEVDKRHLDINNVMQARTLLLRNSILNQCDVRNDQWSADVERQLQDCVDFVAAEAIFHLKCRFYNTACNIEPSVPGRPVTIVWQKTLRNFVIGLRMSVTWK